MGEGAELVLVVHLEDDELKAFRKTTRFCCKPESEGNLIKSVSKSTGWFPYSEPFVSIAVYRSGENICESPATIYGDAGDLKKNCYVILKKTDQILDHIECVALDDFRHVVVQIARRWNSHTPCESLLKQLKDIRKMTSVEKLDALLVKKPMTTAAIANPIVLK